MLAGGIYVITGGVDVGACGHPAEKMKITEKCENKDGKNSSPFLSKNSSF
jgi:hypothetical protein